MSSISYRGNCSLHCIAGKDHRAAVQWTTLPKYRPLNLKGNSFARGHCTLQLNVDSVIQKWRYGIRDTRVRSDMGSSASVGSNLKQMTALEKIADIGMLMFPIWALISASTAFFFPSTLNWMTTTQFEQGVGLLMLSMGLSMTVEDVKKCASAPIPIFLGFICQYSILPLLALSISHLLHLKPAFATGLIVLGCCPGGQASNVATFIANGDVALSVLMTTVSTIAASFMTPLLATLLAGQFIPVNAWALAESTMRLVLLPTCIGIAARELFPSVVEKIRPGMPLVALVLTVILCAVPVAQTNGLSMLGPVVALHGFGYLLGYMLPKVLGFPERTARTVSIETGMQSAAMGYALTTKHFSDILVAVPSAVSVCVMVWIGAALAAAWRMSPTDS
eukprot:jgi/Picsp_1/5482/NSC_02841-R1_bile acid na+ symporter family protein